jgi:hypothetical protein
MLLEKKFNRLTFASGRNGEKFQGHSVPLCKVSGDL